MAVAEYYVPAPLVRYRSRVGFSVRQYFHGTTVGSYLSFGALGAVFFVAVFARQIAPYDPLAAVGQPMTAPNAVNLLGTD
ncbi:MAG: peptide/nickel transport system permease protein, partial [Mycobacterium sp.]|nr:peptide/nickel transport system permease protein [Mycobacterium sp.]